jgi:hypothetical protein
MKRINILGNLASAAPKIALLVTIFASFMIEGSTPVSAQIGNPHDPTLQCWAVGLGPPPLRNPISHWFWVYPPSPTLGRSPVDTGMVCGNTVNPGPGNT